MEQRQEEVLIVAATRPAIMPLVGLPHRAAVILLAVGMETLVITKSIFAPLWLGPPWVVMFMIVRNDVNAIRIIGLWLRRAALSLDVHRWGGGSLSPWPIRERDPRGINAR